MAVQKIRIRLKSYDHEVIDSSARKIVETVTRAGASVVGPVPLPTQKNVFVVTQVRNAKTDGYDAIQLAFGAIDPRKVTNPLKGHFEKAGVTPRRHVAEVRTTNASEFTLGQEMAADVFETGQLVDVTGTTKGKGFAGVMKRHGFHGVGASHGAHRNHRKPGSIGGASTPSRVFKGIKMAGRMGNDRKTCLLY